MGEMADNFNFTTLLHDLKAKFPSVPDDVIKHCILQFGKDKNRCLEFLSKESDRIRQVHFGRYNQQRKFSLQALLAHQLEQSVKLERQLNLTRHEVENVKSEITELEKKLAINQMVGQGKITTASLEREISELRQTCESMAVEVTQLTKGTVPLGETSIDFYESLPTALDQEAGKQDESQGNSSCEIIQNAETNSGLVEEKQWSCSVCTFLNHPALKNCEECDMPRIMIDIDSTTNTGHFQAMISQ